MTATTNLDRAHCIDTIVKASHLRSFEMDKATESAMLQAFNSIVPRGTYLADYLDGSAEAFESAIRSDIVMPFSSSIRETRRELDESAKALAAIKKQIKAEEEKLRAIRRDVGVLMGLKRTSAESYNYIFAHDHSQPEWVSVPHAYARKCPSAPR